MTDDDSLRLRSQKKLLRVTMPGGQVLCYKSNRTTFIEALRMIGIDELKKVNLEIGHLPIISQEVYPKYKEYMKPLIHGWYVNVMSGPEEKYLQLVSIRNQLGIDMKVEIGYDFETDQSKAFQKSKSKDSCLLVKFPDGEYVGEENPIQTYIGAINKLGTDNLKRRRIELAGKKLITARKEYNGQIQLDDDTWLTVPSLTKDKLKWLRIIGSYMSQNLDVSII